MIKVEIPFKASIEFAENRLFFSGSIQLKNKVTEFVSLFGPNPMLWQVKQAMDGYDVLLNEFILKCQNDYKIPYQHDELCHCRMVPTQKVVNTIKQGVFKTSDIGRITMAGTGCGSCKKDIDDLVKYLVK